MNIKKLSYTTLYVVIKNYTAEITTKFLIYIKAISQIISQDIIVLTVTVKIDFFSQDNKDISSFTCVTNYELDIITVVNLKGQINSEAFTTRTMVKL